MTPHPTRATSTVIGLGLLLLGVSACQADVADVPRSECATGRKWVGGSSGSPQMHPGRDCVGCHESGEGPRFAVAGTVYPAEGMHDGDDCFGISGATVLVEDAGGRMYALETNDAGNFWLGADHALQPPLHVELEHDAKTVPMALRPDVGACATCHTREGRELAPGRITVP